MITTKLGSGSEMKIQAKYFPVSFEAVYYMKSLGNISTCCISEFADGYIRRHWDPTGRVFLEWAVSLIYTTLNHRLMTDKYHNRMRERYTFKRKSRGWV